MGIVHKIVHDVFAFYKINYGKISTRKLKASCMLATVVEGDQKAPFSIATTLRRRERRYSFPWIGPFYSWYVPYIAEWEARSYQVPFLKPLVWRGLGLNPGLPDQWWTPYPLSQWAGLLMFQNKRVETISQCRWEKLTHLPSNRNLARFPLFGPFKELNPENFFSRVDDKDITENKWLNGKNPVQKFLCWKNSKACFSMGKCVLKNRNYI